MFFTLLISRHFLWSKHICWQRLVQVECGILKRLPVKPLRSQASFLLNIFLKPSSVKDGLAVAGQCENAGKPNPPALHLHFVASFLFYFILFFHHEVAENFHYHISQSCKYHLVLLICQHNFQKWENDNNEHAIYL